METTGLNGKGQTNSDIDEMDPMGQLMPNGLTVAETNREMARTTEELYKNAFSKGFPMFYRDERANAPGEFIRANPDGSEDLVVYDMGARTYSVVERLMPSGKGLWARAAHEEVFA